MPPFCGENSAAAVEDPLGQPRARIRRDTLWSRRQRPRAPRDPCPPGGGGGSRRQGAPGAVGRIRPPAPSRFPRPPAPGGRAQDPADGSEPLPRRCRETPPPPQKSARASAAGVAFEPPYPSPEESLAPPPGVGHLQGRDSPAAERWYRVAWARHPPPQLRRSLLPGARTPAAAGISPRRPMPSSSGPRQRLPPAAAGGGAKRGLQPLGAPAPARGFPSPSATTRRPPALRPAEAGGRRAVPPEGKQSRVPSRSPSPTHFRRRP